MAFQSVFKGPNSILLCAILSSLASFSQVNGKLTCKITDGATNITLPGVSVTVKGASGTSSIGDGTYIISLPAGTYTVSYSSTGYAAKNVTGVVIKSGQTAFQDIILN